MKVALITKELAESLVGQQYTPGVYFNPVPYNDGWIISLQEHDALEDKTGVIDIIDFVPPEFDEEV